VDANNIEPLVFDNPGPVEVPVKIRNVKGDLEDYVLREAPTGKGVEWRNSVARVLKTDAAGNITSAVGMAATESELVSYCLFKLEADPKTGETVRKPVNVATINLQFPSTVTKELFRVARRISGLLPKMDPTEIRKTIEELTWILKDSGNEESPAKNSPSGSTDSSSSPVDSE
jgi:hypothetical protein